jgi:hypothetical protein
MGFFMVFRVISAIILLSLPVLLILSIVFFVKYFIKKEKKNLVKGIIFISSFVVGIIAVVILWIFMFVLGSFARVGMFGLVERYYYPSHSYNYYVNADYDNPVLDETIKKEFSTGFEIWYGINSFPNQREIIEPNGDMILLKGPPFSFQIVFFRVDRNIDHFYFKEFIFQKDTGEEYNLFDFEEIKMDIYFNRYLGFKIEDENTMEIFRDTGKINTGRLITLGNIEERKRLNKDTNELPNEGFISVIISFRDLPIDFKNDEKFVIRFDFDAVLDDGEINNFPIGDIYKRTYRYLEKLTSFTPPESFGKEKSR